MVKTLRRRIKKNLSNKLSKKATIKLRGGDSNEIINFTNMISKFIVPSSEETYYVSFHRRDDEQDKLLALYSYNKSINNLHVIIEDLNSIIPPESSSSLVEDITPDETSFLGTNPHSIIEPYPVPYPVHTTVPTHRRRNVPLRPIIGNNMQ